MDFNLWLAFHSNFRWIVLIALLSTLLYTYSKTKSEQNFSNFDKNLIKLNLFIAIIQLILGIVLYTQSGIVEYFYSHYPETVKMREIRFFGMEHVLMMPIALSIFVSGGFKGKRINGIKGYKIWYKRTWWAFILILLSIPWSFWALVSRPLWRSIIH